jgi:phosphoribosylanthranilate isomerase
VATRIKFCGITRLEDAVAVVDAGAWAIGFILWPKSPRFVAPEEAQLIARQLRRRVRVAGVFVDQGLDEVVRTAEQIGLDLIQLHGN